MAIDNNKGVYNYVTPQTYKQKPDPLDPGVSQTIPGEAKTIKKIMEEALRGYTPPERSVQFIDQEDLDKINEFYTQGPLDLTDLDRLAEANLEAQKMIEDAIARRDAEPEPEPEPVPDPEPEPTPTP